MNVNLNLKAHSSQSLDIWQIFCPPKHCFIDTYSSFSLCRRQNQQAICSDCFTLWLKTSKWSNQFRLVRQKKLLSGGNVNEQPTTCWVLKGKKVDIGRQRHRAANNMISPLFERTNYDIGRQYNNRRPKKSVFGKIKLSWYRAATNNLV
jgi:hypothetical protein